MRASLKSLFAAAMVAASGCGESPSEPPVTPPPLPKVISMTVTAPSTTLQPGSTAQLMWSCEWSDGKATSCPSGLTWASTDPNVASVTGAGFVTAVSPGNTQIIASAWGVSASLGLEVQAPPPVVTVSLAGEDTLVQDFIRASTGRAGGKIVKFDSIGTVKVQVPEELISSADSIFEFWHDLWGYNFQAVVDSADADIVVDLTHVGVEEYDCGFGGPTLIHEGRILRARIVLRPGYCATGLAGVQNLAHEIGHALGLQAHTPLYAPGVFDIMIAGPTGVFSSQTLERIVRFYRASPAGAVVKD